MKKDIVIVDDVVPKSYQNLIERELLFNPGWLYTKDVAYGDTVDKNVKRTPGMSNLLYSKKSTVAQNNMYVVLKPLIYMIAEKVDVNFKEIMQVRSFMHFPIREEMRKQYDNIHVDLQMPHVVFLYYVNDTDGDTFVFKNTINDTPFTNPTEISKQKMEILQKISPKKGRVVVFNGNRYHSSSGPTKDIRCIVNINVGL